MGSVLVADRWIDAVLRADSTLRGLVSDRIFNNQAKCSFQTAYPMIIFQRQSEQAVMGVGKTIIMQDCVYLVKAISRQGYTECEPIVNRVRELLHGAAGTVAGYGSVLGCVAEGTVSFVEFDDVEFWTLGIEFRIWAQ